MSDETLLSVGLMSGTSADAIDAALVAVQRSPRRLNLRHYIEIPHPPERRSRILKAARGQANSAEICALNAALGQAFGETVASLCAEAGVALEAIDVIGSHGQTVWHAPHASPPGSLQLADPAIIAMQTETPVVADFRSADLAWGGEGAPLTPLLHHVLFGHPTLNRAVVNLGGIANVTRLPAGGEQAQLMALDSGPGNMLLDGLVSTFSNGRDCFDKDGQWAASGQVDGAWLAGLRQHSYFSRAAPKSTGRELFGDDFLASVLARADAEGTPAADTLATLTALTADTVAQAIAGMGPVDEVLLCGGGVHNRALVDRLAAALSPARVGPCDAWGIPGDALEAMAFAELACRHLWQEAGNLPQVTGANRSVVLGSLTPASG